MPFAAHWPPTSRSCGIDGCTIRTRGPFGFDRGRIKPVDTKTDMGRNQQQDQDQACLQITAIDQQGGHGKDNHSQRVHGEQSGYDR